MAISANDVRVGDVIHHNGRLWAVLKKEHVKPGKGGAFVQLEMKEITQGTKTNERFRSTETLEKAFIEDIDYQYQYTDKGELALMDMNTFEQISLPEEIAGSAKQFLQEGMNVKVKYTEGKPVSMTLPDTVALEVTETEAVVKGQTATSSYKPATLENGARVMVPQFIGSGDVIVVKTEDASYVERYKNNHS